MPLYIKANFELRDEKDEKDECPDLGWGISLQKGLLERNLSATLLKAGQRCLLIGQTFFSVVGGKIEEPSECVVHVVLVPAGFLLVHIHVANIVTPVVV